MALNIDFTSISIEKIIVHDIPRHRQNDYSIQPNYSEQVSEIPDGLRVFFKDKVVSALSSDKAFKICYDIENPSPVPPIVIGMLNSSGQDFVNNTKDIARQLFEIQVGVNAAGILVFIGAKINGFNACMILKLERDAGAQLTLNPVTRSFNIVEVENLMLTKKTKIFKVALFIQKQNFKCKYDGVIMDYQINVKEKKDVLTYFIDKFLGCKAFEDPKITTKNFYNHTRTFIDTIDDQILRTKYIQDLNSYLQKNTPVLNPREFADDYFKSTTHKDNYRNFLESKNFKFTSFPRDTQLIDNKVKKIMLTFDNDITIIGNKGTLDKKVKLERLKDGRHRAEITSKIRKVA